MIWVARTMRPGRWIAARTAAIALLFAAAAAQAQFTAPYVILQGQLANASGNPAANATLTLAPSQLTFVAGTGVVVGSAQCSTDLNGAVVGIQNPASPPRLSAITGTGTLPANNYYVEFAWYDQFGGVTQVSREAVIQLTATGSIQILPPVGSGPPNAVGMSVYVGLGSGSESRQGQTLTPTAALTINTPLQANQPRPPIANSTSCRVFANDAEWPTGTGYYPSLTDASGNTLMTYTEMWQFTGPGSTYNLSSGLPYYHGQVTYPVPILTIPYNHNPQSISGALSMTGYNIFNVGALGVGTGTPAWGVDVEGTGAAAAINANQGYLVNGAAGTSGQCLSSDGSYFDTPINCVQALPTIYYQTMRHSGTNLPQESYLSDGPGIVFSNVLGPPSLTQVAVNGTGTDLKVVTAAAAGTSGNCMQWSATGGAADAGAPCAVAQSRTCNANGCYRIEGDGTIEEWGQTTTFGGADAGTFTLTFPHPFTSLSNLQVVFSPSQCVGGSPSYCAGVPGGTPNDAYACFIETPSLTAPTVVYSAGATLIAGASCYWHAYGN